METERQPLNLNYAEKVGPQRRLDPGVAAFFCALIFLPSFVLTGLGGLHGELNRFGALVWLAIGILTTCFVAAAWEQRTWLGARTRLGRAGTVLAVFGWILGCMAVFGPRYDPHDSDLRRQVKCASNLRQIGQALVLYASDHGGQYPERPDELLSLGVEPEIFVCPSTDDLPARGQTSRDINDAFASGGHLSYVYVAKGLTTSNVGAQHVLAFEPMRNHATDHPGIHVLFGDGRVEFLQGDAAQRLTERLHLGENPPTGWR
jgi:hypothetical protein